MGGSGTIAIEAATQYEGVCAVTSDNNSIATSAAIKNCVLARPHLRAGSKVRAEDWDARNLAHVSDASIDCIVTDMPFGNRCKFDAAEDLPKMLAEMARVLKDGGKAVILMKGYRRVEALLTGRQTEAEIDHLDVAAEATKDSAEPDTEEQRIATRVFKRGKGYCRVKEPLACVNSDDATDGLPAKHQPQTILDSSKSCAQDCLSSKVDHLAAPTPAVACEDSSSCFVEEDMPSPTSMACENPMQDLPRPTAQGVANEFALQLSIIERRPVAIGGYLCYALVLQRTSYPYSTKADHVEKIISSVS